MSDAIIIISSDGIEFVCARTVAPSIPMPTRDWEAHRRAIGTKFPLPITIKAPPRRTWSCLPLRANRTRSDAGGFNCNGYREHRTYCSSVCFPVAGRPIPRKHLITLWISSIDVGYKRQTKKFPMSIDLPDPHLILKDLTSVYELNT